jgi:hypothetical protein
MAINNKRLRAGINASFINLVSSKDNYTTIGSDNNGLSIVNTANKVQSGKLELDPPQSKADNISLTQPNDVLKQANINMDINITQEGTSEILLSNRIGGLNVIKNSGLVYKGDNLPINVGDKKMLVVQKNNNNISLEAVDIETTDGGASELMLSNKADLSVDDNTFSNNNIFDYTNNKRISIIGSYSNASNGNLMVLDYSSKLLPSDISLNNLALLNTSALTNYSTTSTNNSLYASLNNTNVFNGTNTFSSLLLSGNGAGKITLAIPNINNSYTITLPTNSDLSNNSTWILGTSSTTSPYNLAWIDLGNLYLSKASAASTYLTQTNAASTYLTQTNAATSYLTQISAASTYLAKNDASSTYLSQTSAASSYLTQANAASIYDTLNTEKTITGNKIFDYSLCKLSLKNTINDNTETNQILLMNANGNIVPCDKTYSLLNSTLASGALTNVANTFTAAQTFTYGNLKLNGTGANSITLNAPSTLATSYTWNLPLTNPTSGATNVLYTTSTSGPYNLAWLDLNTVFLTQTNAASTYLTSAAAASTYLTQTNAASTYLTQTNAASTYLTSATAATTYGKLANANTWSGVNTFNADKLVLAGNGGDLTINASQNAASATYTLEYPTAAPAGTMNVLTTSGAAPYSKLNWVDLSTYLTSAAAASTYLTQTNAASTYLTSATAASTYLTQTNAASTYLTSATAASTYLTQTNAASTYLTSATAASTYLTQTNAASTYAKNASSNTFTATNTFNNSTGGIVLSNTSNDNTLSNNILVLNASGKIVPCDKTYNSFTTNGVLTNTANTFVATQTFNAASNPIIVNNLNVSGTTDSDLLVSLDTSGNLKKTGIKYNQISSLVSAKIPIYQFKFEQNLSSSGTTNYNSSAYSGTFTYNSNGKYGYCVQTSGALTNALTGINTSSGNDITVTGWVYINATSESLRLKLLSSGSFYLMLYDSTRGTTGFNNAFYLNEITGYTSAYNVGLNSPDFSQNANINKWWFFGFSWNSSALTLSLFISDGGVNKFTVSKTYTASDSTFTNALNQRFRNITGIDFQYTSGGTFIDDLRFYNMVLNTSTLDGIVAASTDVVTDPLIVVNDADQLISGAKTYTGNQLFNTDKFLLNGGGVGNVILSAPNISTGYKYILPSSNPVSGTTNVLTTSSTSSPYSLSWTDLASTYLTQTNAASIYLTQANATSTYLTSANAVSTYLTSATAASTYLTSVSAASTYLTQANAGTTYMKLSGTNANSATNTWTGVNTFNTSNPIIINNPNTNLTTASSTEKLLAIDTTSGAIKLTSITQNSLSGGNTTSVASLFDEEFSFESGNVITASFGVNRKFYHAVLNTKIQVWTPETSAARIFKENKLNYFSTPTTAQLFIIRDNALLYPPPGGNVTTISTWIRWTAGGTGGTDLEGLGLYDESNFLVFTLKKDNDNLAFRYRNTSDVTVDVSLASFTSTNPLFKIVDNLNKWVFVSITLDGVANKMSVYIRSVDSILYNGTYTIPSAFTNTRKLGAFWLSSSVANGVNIANFFISKQALTNMQADMLSELNSGNITASHIYSGVINSNTFRAVPVPYEQINLQDTSKTASQRLKGLNGVFNNPNVSNTTILGPADTSVNNFAYGYHSLAQATTISSTTYQSSAGHMFTLGGQNAQVKTILMWVNNYNVQPNSRSLFMQMRGGYSTSDFSGSNVALYFALNQAAGTNPATTGFFELGIYDTSNQTPNFTNGGNVNFLNLLPFSTDDAAVTSGYNTDKNWHLIGFAYDTVARKIYCYCDGVRVGISRPFTNTSSATAATNNLLKYPYYIMSMSLHNGTNVVVGNTYYFADILTEAQAGIIYNNFVNQPII